MAGLTPKQQKFCDFYIKTGHATESAIAAGYKKSSAYSVGSENLKKPEIQDYIQSKAAKLDKRRTASMEEVHEFWYNTMTDMEVAQRDRLKASEYIAKTHGAFLDRVELSGGVELKTDVIKKYLKRQSKGGTGANTD